MKTSLRMGWLVVGLVVTGILLPACADKDATIPEAAKMAAPGVAGPGGIRKSTAPPGVATARANGFFGVHEKKRIVGWAWDKTQPNVPLNVDIYDGDKLLGTVAANIFREQLVKEHKGDGMHAF